MMHDGSCNPMLSNTRHAVPETAPASRPWLSEAKGRTGASNVRHNTSHEVLILYLLQLNSGIAFPVHLSPLLLL